MQDSKPSKLRRELVRPARQLGKFLHRTTSRVYSPYLYDLTQRLKVRVSTGSIGMRDHVAIYVMAPFDGVWPSHLAALEYLENAGASPVVVSNLALSPEERTRISDRASVVIERPNQGYDFGAYREGVLYLGARLEGLSRLSLFNDSVWFPVPAASNWFEAVENEGTEITGAASNFGASRTVPRELVAETWKYGSAGAGFHFPSFALSFSASALRTPAFRRFWSRYPLVNSKELTILRGEIGLSQWALAQGFSASSTYPVVNMDKLLEPLSTPRLREIAENLIVLGNPKFLALKHRTLQEPTNRNTLLALLLAATRCLGVSYAFADFNLAEMKFPFLKKSPVWHQNEASEITMRLLEKHGFSPDTRDEAEFLRRTRLIAT
ncbi:hypothetical protein FGK63_04735 [Ruegeria sediminis]|uniref:Rhamnan synthesis protein F n=1 Tax=Ruegeria sediminis TaxID=2583820 RepID=A0ABY2X0F9_9RHOB|nr:rhamnan synthesis F family protein [Ruegeria sediminis]TMV08447.1 hypothetical protein FGK63_04735 [Ruegeria sediminis]